MVRSSIVVALQPVDCVPEIDIYVNFLERDFYRLKFLESYFAELILILMLIQNFSRYFTKSRLHHGRFPSDFKKSLNTQKKHL